ncbi:unnamed protein product [Nyctereutes procyonoides]|uniref:(raccoon dog) hypothetical protein n=1 Tax=Nyctereutes procyonoides TaxID=34880 RepID=A0A811YS10_NYCPR|nr:unnamed protein product [Nyctereutes procyonoides]
MPGAESKPMHIVVPLLIHLPDLDESPVPLATPEEEEEAPVPAMEVPDMNVQPPASGEQRPAVPKQHPEPCQEPTPAPLAGPTEASGPVIEPVTAAGAECLVRVEMRAAESTPMHVVVTPLLHCPDLEEPAAPLATVEEELAPAPTIKVPDMPKESGVSGEQPVSAPEQ